MKKILVIANLFHASPRIPNVATHLRRFGYEPWIVTPPLDAQSEERLGLPMGFREHVRLIEVPYRGDVLWPWRRLFRRISGKKTGSVTEEIKRTIGASEGASYVHRTLYAYQAVFGYPDTEKGWIKPVRRKLASLDSMADFHAVLSSSPYPTSHLIAQEVKDRYHIPWLADFRDPWSENHNYAYGRIRRALDRRLEKRTLANSDAITAASPSYAAKQQRLHERKVTSITNGFDPDSANEATRLTDSFTITYAGSIYRDKQNPELFLQSVRELIDEGRLDGDKTVIRFYGEPMGWVHSLVEKYHLTGIVSEHGRITRRESFSRQRESQVLLVFGWEDAQETGVYPLKLFEYLAAKRPILVCGGSEHEEIKEIVRQTNAGSSGVGKSEIKTLLSGYSRSFTETGSVPYEGRAESISAYAWPSIAQKFSCVLDTIVEG